MTKETFDLFVREFKPRYQDRSPIVVYEKKFHVLMRDYIIPLPQGYDTNDLILQHQDNCECKDIPSHIVKHLVVQTKKVLDQVKGKFSYAAFVFAHPEDKKQVHHHLHIQSLLPPIQNNKEIAIFVSFEGSYTFEYFKQIVSHNVVKREKLFLRNENDHVADFVSANNWNPITHTIKPNQYVLFNGQTMIHGGHINSGCGIWIVLSLCEADISCSENEVIINDY